MNRIIIFFIRKKLGLKKYQKFYLKNQKMKNDRYFFSEDTLFKEMHRGKYIFHNFSNIRLNFLLSDEIKKLMVIENE